MFSANNRSLWRFPIKTQNQTTSLTPFAFDDKLLRTITDEHGNPWFVAKDVCRVLEIENVGNVLAALDDDEKITIYKCG